jgi:hypothetical protein
MKARNREAEGSTNQGSGGEVKLVLKEIDPQVASAEMSQQLEQIRKSVERIEEAKVVRKQLLDKEVSI